MSSRDRLKLAVVIGASAAFLCLLFFFDPAKSNFYLPCPFHAITGFYCPGCGSLRAIHQLLYGHPVAAFGLNPLMILSLPFLGGALIYYGVRPSLTGAYIPALGIWVILLIIVLFWVLRNIPVYPFNLLAP